MQHLRAFKTVTIIEGQALIHTVCRKTKAKAFGDFAYDFTVAVSKNVLALWIS